MSNSNIYICTGRWCHELGAIRIFKKVKMFFKKEKHISVEQCRCLGYCEQGVNAMKNGRIYHDLTEEHVIEQLSATPSITRSPTAIDLSDDFLGDI